MDKGLIVAPVAMVGILGMIYANNKRGNKPDIDTSNTNLLRNKFENKNVDIVEGFGDLSRPLQPQNSVRFGGKTKYNKRKRHQNKTKRKSI